MKHFLLDSNCILRYLLNDIPKQADIVEGYLKQCKKGNVTLYVPVLAFVESVFIMFKLYKLEKKDIVDRLSDFANIPFLEIENKMSLLSAFKLYSNYNVSFVDSLFLTEAKQTGKQLLTFDKKLKKLI